MTKQLPHDEYIAAVADALTAAGLHPADAFTDDSDTSGSHFYLRAVITLDDSSGIPATRWRHGLILIWEWHTGIEAADGEPERGPSWEWARLVDEHGQCGEREALTAIGYASPAYVVESVRALIERRNQSTPAERWERADGLDAACEAWGIEETSERPEKCPECGATRFDFAPNHCDGISQGHAWLCTGCKWGQWLTA
ncbi:hypothetical protein [Streptomyces sp. A012304]|uniref:hypothetical protein n=1 Tax=Streptomyces sp. A012304 TaxID=375446 RepID=UPI002230F146|nr:hypothetical protein [Streptomyces sp. A012304]GKQ35153.1 hypothetical protein ALMP_16990 [Streptomyces sp. A012304]